MDDKTFYERQYAAGRAWQYRFERLVEYDPVHASGAPELPTDEHIVVEFNATDLAHLGDALTRFARACGFGCGQLRVVEDEED